MEVKFKLAFSTNAYTSGKYKTTDAIKKIASLGYEGVEILADYPLLWPFSTSEKEIGEIKKLLKEKNLGCTINAFTCTNYWRVKGRIKSDIKSRTFNWKFGPCFCDYEEEYRDLRIKYTKRVIDLARKVGARDVSTCSGYRPLRGTRELAWKNTVEALRKVVEYAEKRGVRINIEPEPGLLVGSAKEAEAILREIDSPNFGLNFDVGHFFVSDGNTIPELVKKFRKKINNVHVEDIGLDEKGRPVHHHLVPGLGVINLLDVFKALKKINYGGFCTVELYTYSKKPVFATRESMKYLKRLIKNLK